jgi:ribosomal protein L12E/L44/L45/RPP1/RPP2
MWITYGPAGGTSVSVAGWRITQANSTNSFTLPAGTTIPAGGYLIVARSATKSAFETFWRGGSPLPTNAVYVNSAGALPVINGDETFTLLNAAGTRVDGATIAMPASALSTVQRKDPCLAAGTSSSWTITASANATPGSGAGAGCAKGVVINEFADAAGTGNFVFEFVELHNDQ